MLQQLKDKLQEEETQRAILKGTAMVAVFIATNVFSTLATKAAKSGIDALMEKLHPTVEVPAE